MSCALDNHANQLNQNNDVYYQSRGFDGRPDDWNDNNETNNGSDYSSYNYDSENNISSDYDSDYFEHSDLERTRKRIRKRLLDQKVIEFRMEEKKEKVRIDNLEIINLRNFMDKNKYTDWDFRGITPIYSIPKLKYKKTAKNDEVLSGDFILYKFSFSKIKNEIEKNKNVKIKCVFYENEYSNASRSFIRIENNSNNIKNLEDSNILINEELNKLFKQELKYNKIVDKIKKYHYYPYNFLELNFQKYGDSCARDYIWKEGENIKKYFKYNNLSLLKRNSYTWPFNYSYSEISEHISKNKISQCGYGRNERLSLNKWDFIIIPSEMIINNFVNEIRNIYNNDNIFSNFIIFDKLRKKSFDSFDSFSRLIGNIDKESSEIFINFLQEIFPCLILYITKNGTLSLINENNNKMIYEYKLPEKYSNNKITNICLLENDNILIELDKILLLEFNIITSELKSFLYESKENISKNEENKLKKIENILKNNNLNSNEKLQKISIIF